MGGTILVTSMNPPVIPRSLWQHRNGQIYSVFAIANKESTNSKYPITVVYVNVRTRTIWTRPLDDWHRSMTLLPT